MAKQSEAPGLVGLLRFRVPGLRGSGFRVSGLGFRVSGLRGSGFPGYFSGLPLGSAIGDL